MLGVFFDMLSSIDVILMVIKLGIRAFNLKITACLRHVSYNYQPQKMT